MSRTQSHFTGTFWTNPYRGIQLLVLSLILSVCLAMPNARADDSLTTFESANKLYAEGKYSEAVNAYDKLLAGGSASEAVYFNRGNAQFKLGEIGRAIASYRQAQKLAPRDPQLRANLQIARTRARGGSPYSSDRWRDWLNTLSLNEWAILAAVSLWLLFGSLALGQWRTPLKPRLRPLRLLATMVLVFSGACLALVVNHEYLTPSAIVVVGEADVRNGPLEESQSIFKVRDGVELDVTDSKDGWLQVVDSTRRTGWIRQEQVISTGGRPLSPDKSA